MHIDLTAAGLLAQVIPTLLIFLLLEGRLRKPTSAHARGPATKIRLAHVFFRTLAIFMNLGATFACLIGVMSGETDWAPYIDVLVIASVVLLFFSLYFMLIGMTMREYRDNM